MGSAHIGNRLPPQMMERPMPFIRITVSGPTLVSNQVSLLQMEMTELMVAVIGERADLTSVLVEQAASAGWAIGGTPVKIAVHVDAMITAGTNSAEERARFIEKTIRLLKSVLGSELHPATYVVVTEVPANAWGMMAEHSKAGSWPPDIATGSGDRPPLPH
jgi:4-oxalocrotonate tautomerase